VISLTCTSCQKVLEIDDAFAGGVCRCQFCGTIQTVPARLKGNSKIAGPVPGAKTLYQKKVRPSGAPSSGLENLADQVVPSSGLTRGALKANRSPSPAPPPPKRNLLPIFVTISGDRLSSRVDWLPLRASILDGLSSSRPSASVAAVEAWTGRRVDHLAVVEWAAFSDLGHDNGVLVDLAPGAGRAAQQAVLREVLDESLHTAMRKKPWLLYRAMHTVASGMAVEQEWSTVDMHALAISLRDLRSAEILLGSAGAPVAEADRQR
jgi:hypothetical protein